MYCRGISTFLMAVAGIGFLNAESLAWQYGTNIESIESFESIRSLNDSVAAQVASSAQAASSSTALDDENSLIVDSEAESSSSAGSAKGSTKLNGLDPKPNSSKMTLQMTSLLDSQWGMLKSPGLNLKDAWNFLIQKKVVKSNKAFNCSFSPITVAIVDTGVDFNHQNLKNISWVNKTELNGKKGVDDDKNGFVDDINGWDFTNNSPLIVDGHGHGTHLAGIISGQSPEPSGFKGVCPGIRIMSLRYFASDMTGLKNLENTVKAIRYAVKNGANIINYSGGGSSYAHDEYVALKEATEKGILIVAAAGNERSDTAQRPYFPASYDLKSIISVAGVGADGKLIPASNWGKSTVDVAAPGGGILSLQQNQSYGFMNGTSQATAFVSGLAGLLWSLNPKLKALEVKSLIERSVTKSKFLKNKVLAEGTVDAGQAMKLLADFKGAKPKALSPQIKKVPNPRILSGLQGAEAKSVEERE